MFKHFSFLKISECSKDLNFEECNELCGLDKGCFVECQVMEIYPAVKEPELATIWLPLKLIIIGIFLLTVACIAGSYKCFDALCNCYWKIREKENDEMKAVLV